MALTYGFFSSKDGDRKYNAKQFGAIFDGIINDGVYDSIGDCFKVTSPESGMKVNVGTGRAWFLHTWTLNTSPASVAISNSEPLLDRWDAVVLDIDHRDDYRKNSFKVIKGEAASNPIKPTEFANTSNHKQVPLAYVYVRHGATKIIDGAYPNGDITNVVGTSKCPFVNGILEVISTDALISDWRVGFTKWMGKNEQLWEANMDHNAIAWWNWFNNLQYILDGDVAGHLQEQIDEIAKFKHIYVVDKVLYVPMSGASVSDKKLIFTE